MFLDEFQQLLFGVYKLVLNFLLILMGIFYNLNRMINLFAFMGLIYVCRSIYDTTLVANTTYLELRIGEFKKISLPFNFKTYYSIDAGKAEATSKAGVTEDICVVDEREFNFYEIDYLSISGLNMMYKDVVTEYQMLLQRRYLIDMIAVNNTLFVAFTDTIRVITLEPGNLMIGKIYNNITLPEPLTTGKFLKASEETLYFVGPNVIYSINNTQVTKLEGYNSIDSFQSAAILNQNIILVAAAKSGVHAYRVNENQTLTNFSIIDDSFLNESVDVSDIQSSNNFVYLLNRYGSIIRLSLKQDNQTLIKQNTYKLNRTGCQNIQIHDGDFYITCPQLHRIKILNQQVIDKVFQNPNFNPRNIVFFNSIIIVVGHNLAKIYNEGVEMGYYHDYIMRKIVPFKDKILIASDYGLSLTTWDVNQPEITCGLKRRSTTQKYEGKVSTTINVIAQCNEQYFRENNISYGQQLKNDVCLYHFPISINFWVGREINYLPFKIGILIIILVCSVVLIGWFTLNKKIKGLTNAIKHYSQVAQTTNHAGYADMVEQPHQDKNSEGSDLPQKQLHEIGD